MKLNIFIYSLKIWLTSVILSPVVLIGIGFITSGRYNHIKLPYDFYWYAIGLFAGLAFSLPSVAIFGLVAYGVAAINGNLLVKKLILSIAGILLTGMAIILVKKVFSPTELIVVTGTYGVFIMAGIWFYNVKTEDDIRDIPNNREFT